MRTWAIKHNDIDIFGGKVQEITGADKVAQDIKQWLMNDIGFNRFHPEVGSSLDEYVGSFTSPEVLGDIRRRVINSLSAYYQSQVADLKERIDESIDKTYAIGIAEPSSIIRQWESIDVLDDRGSIKIRITFSTQTRDLGRISLSIT